MNIKKYLVIGALVGSLAGLPIANAHMSAHQGGQHSHAKVLKLVPKEQRTEFEAMLKNTRLQLLPLVKEKRALRMQEMGLLATSGAHWEDISAIVDKLNANNAAITKLLAKSQFEIFNKFGVILSPPHARFM